MPYIGEILPRMRFHFDGGKQPMVIEVFGIREFPMQETEITYRFADSVTAPPHGSLYGMPESAFREACQPVHVAAPEEGRVWGN